jgi:dolichol-phosphate mannosyltransferase
MLNLAANAITCFSIRPLQLFSLLGVLATAGTVLLALVYLVSYFCSITVPGLTTLYLLLLANLSVLLLGFGTLGEYIGRIYIETKRRPLYVVSRTINLDEVPPQTGHVFPGPHHQALIPAGGNNEVENRRR